MSEHRRALTCPAGASVTRRRRLLVGVVGAIGASGLMLGAAGIPVSAGDVNAGGNPSASVDVQDGCVTAVAGTGGADGSVTPQQGEAATLDAAGQGTATLTVCREDLGDAPSPDDPGGSLPDDPGEIVPGELDDVVPDELDDVMPGEPDGSLEAEVHGILTAALDGDLPGGGDGSPPGDLPDGLDGVIPDDGDGFPGDPGDGSFPGDPGDLPGGLGGLVPGGSGIDAGDLLDRLGEIISGVGGGGAPGGGNGGGAPAVNTSTNGSGSVSVGGVDAEKTNLVDVIVGGEFGGGDPAVVGTTVSPGATLPRTGGLDMGVLRLVAWLGLGRGLLGLARRR